MKHKDGWLCVLYAFLQSSALSVAKCGRLWPATTVVLTPKDCSACHQVPTV